MTTGFSRPRPELEVAETAQARAGATAGRPSVPESPVAPAVDAARSLPAESADPGADLAAVAREIAGCMKCGLSVGRTMTVSGEGPLEPLVMFIGEGPGADEEASGRPFVGAAGQYLDKWLKGIEIDRQKCFIANCVKCRPPQNREPHPEELTACMPYLERQISLVRPRLICCLGRVAAQNVLSTTKSLGELRGKVYQRKGIPVVVTYHPSAVLRDPGALRKPVWEDLKLLRSLLAT